MNYLSLLFLILGFVFLIKGADLLVEGASALAQRYGVSLLVIGLTVVAFGTSAPELVVNILASLRGQGSLAVGNIFGSNIANILLVLGAAAAISSLDLHRDSLKLDLPVSMGAIVLLLLILGAAEGTSWAEGSALIMSRGDGLLFLGIFFVYQFYLFKKSKSDLDKKHDVSSKHLPVSTSLWYIVGGLVGLGLGGDWIVKGGKDIALYLTQALGYQNAEGIVGLTIVAIGTSLPELVTSVVAALKGRADLAVGNVLGSNTFNLLWVMGLSSTIAPLTLHKGFYLEMTLIMLASLLIFLFAWLPPRGYLAKYQGYLMLTLYGGYLLYLLIP